MKKISITFLAVITVFISVTSCGDDLNTYPSDQKNTEQLFETVDGCYAALNGLYRNFYTTDWSSYATENFGPASVNIAAEAMGEDFVIREMGSAWFWYDYRYWVRDEINNKGDRPFVFWDMFYQYINNANGILKYIDTAEGDDELRKSIKAQALAVRAYSYFYLIRFYQRTYTGHENDPGVPIYLEPATTQTQGKGRGTVEDVYSRINEDLDDAILLLAETTVTQQHKSHIDLYVAYGLKSRVALVQEDWDTAAKAAAEAKKKPGMKLMGAADLMDGFNTVTNGEWMWGSEVIDSQSTNWYSFFNHMDADAGGHAESARKLGSSWLYAMIEEGDVRKQWFKKPTGLPANEEPKLGSDVSYVQTKFRIKTKGSWAADYIYMRGVEMYLNEAEALCQQGEYGEARTLLQTIGDIRYEDGSYAERLAKRTDSKELTLRSSESMEVKTLMDEIILQRRIELWGEGFRVFDIMRLKTGFVRDFPDIKTNHPVAFDNTDPESWEWIMMIPMTEFNSNNSLDYDRDQNP